MNRKNGHFEHFFFTCYLKEGDRETCDRIFELAGIGKSRFVRATFKYMLSKPELINVIVAEYHAEKELKKLEKAQQKAANKNAR